MIKVKFQHSGFSNSTTYCVGKDLSRCPTIACGECPGMCAHTRVQWLELLPDFSFWLINFSSVPSAPYNVLQHIFNADRYICND